MIFFETSGRNVWKLKLCLQVITHDDTNVSMCSSDPVAGIFVMVAILKRPMSKWMVVSQQLLNCQI